MGTLKQYANLIFGLLFLLIVTTAYIKGRFDGKSASEVKDYKQQVAAYEGAMDRSMKAYEQASHLQELDFKAAMKASEERQQKILESLQRTNQLHQSLNKNQHIKGCVLDEQSIELINKSLKGT